MTSPISPRISERISDVETPEIPVLTPSVKIFTAVTIIIGGAAVAIAFWKATLDFQFFSFAQNPAIDQRISTAPIPLSKPSGKEVSLPTLLNTPPVDAGQGKYQQMYQPPVLEPPKNREISEQSVSLEKKTQAMTKTITEKPEILKREPLDNRSNTKFEPIHKVQIPLPPEKSGDFGKIQKEPPHVPGNGFNDQILSLFQFADNVEQGRRVELGIPENPFLTPSSSQVDMKNRNDINNDLIPLQIPVQTPVPPKSLETLVPLQPFHSKTIELEPLKINPKS
jgi:hypothetical protein